MYVFYILQRPGTSTNSSAQNPTSDNEYDESDVYRASHRVNLDLDVHDKNLTPEQIATLFIEIAQRAEKCFDFEISEWLLKYDQLRQHPNFAEAALLIASASQIYARKVDYLEDMVLQMTGANGKKDKKEDNEDQTKVVRRKGRKFRPNTIADSFSEVEFIVKEFTQLPSAKLTEIVQKKKTDFDSHWEKFKASQCRFLKTKKNKLVVSKKMTENSELIATNATFGKTHIYDYDGEEVVGTKSDFRCFANIINENCELIPDYNFTQYFEHVDLVDQEEEKRQQMEALGLPSKPRHEIIGAKRFQFYISKEYLKENYGIEVETTHQTLFKKSIMASGNSEKSLLLDQSIEDFADMASQNDQQLSQADLNDSLNMSADSGKSIVSMDSAYMSITDGDISSRTLDPIIEEPENEIENIEATADQTQEKPCSSTQDNAQEMPSNTAESQMNDTFFDAVESHDMDIDHELTALNINQSIDQNHDKENRLSVDEGISVHSPSIRSPNCLSETGSEINLDMIFQPGSDAFFERIRNSMDMDDIEDNAFELLSVFDENELGEIGNIYRSNFFYIDQVYLEHQEDFQLPINYFLKPAVLTKNILKIPEVRLRRKCLFSLPPDEFTLKQMIVSIFFFLQFHMCTIELIQFSNFCYR